MDITKKAWRRDLAGREFSFFGNASILATGSALASLISLAAEPIASRLFPPEVFGIVYAFYSLMAIIGLIMCFRYEQAIVLPDNHSDAAGLLKLSSLLLLGWIIVFYIFIGTTDMVAWLGWEPIRRLVWLLPVLSGLIGLWYMLMAWFTRKKKFIHISISSILVQVPQVFFIIIGGYLGFNTAVHLIDYRIVGVLFPPLFLLVLFMIHNSWIFKIKHRVQDLIELAKRYRKFPLFEFWSIMMSVIAFNGPVLLFPVLFDAASAGYFSKGVFVLYVIPIMIGNFFQPGPLPANGRPEEQGAIYRTHCPNDPEKCHPDRDHPAHTGGCCGSRDFRRTSGRQMGDSRTIQPVIYDLVVLFVAEYSAAERLHGI